MKKNNFFNPPSNKTVRIMPLGGCSEFGMNSTLFMTNKTTLMVDLGIMFPNKELLGVDALIPDTEKILNDCKKMEAYVLTHGHEDHIGAFSFYFEKKPLPVYATPWTAELLKLKVSDSTKGTLKKFLRVVRAGDVIDVGDFSIEYIHVNHSIPDACSLLIKASGVSVFHSGDFKIDHKAIYEPVANIERMKEIGQEGLDLLLCDSTSGQNAGRTGSEADVLGPIEEIISAHRGNLYLTTFSSNLWRLISIFEIAERMQKKVCVVGRGMHKSLEVASRLGLYSPTKNVQIPEEQVKDHYGNLIILTTGCQGEKFAGLSRIVWGHHKALTIQPDDVVLFSSRVIPGNDKEVFKIQNEVERAGGICVTTRKNPGIHVSGHGSSDDVSELIDHLKPSYFLPIHGTYSHENNNRMTQVKNGFEKKRTLTMESGDLIEVSPGGKCKKIDNIERYYLYLDGPRKIPMEKPLLNQRLKIGASGLILVTGAVTGKKNIVCSIEIELIGFPISKDIDKVIGSLATKIENQSKIDNHDIEAFEETTRIMVRNKISDLTGKKVPTLVRFHQV